MILQDLEYLGVNPRARLKCVYKLRAKDLDPIRILTWRAKGILNVSITCIHNNKKNPEITFKLVDKNIVPTKFVDEVLEVNDRLTTSGEIHGAYMILESWIANICRSGYK